MDEFGKWWKVHDPLWGVGFYNPKEVGVQHDRVHWLKREDLPKINLPEEDQQRTLWLYLKRDVQLASGAMLGDQLYQAYELWCKATKGGMKSQGGQNTPTHTPGGSNDSAAVRQGRLLPARLAIEHASVPEEGDADMEVRVDSDGG